MEGLSKQFKHTSPKWEGLGVLGACPHSRVGMEAHDHQNMQFF